MAHRIDKHPLPHLNPALVVGALWGGLAVAVAIYDIGRWMDAW